MASEMSEREANEAVALKIMGWKRVGEDEPFRFYLQDGGVITSSGPEMFRRGVIPDKWSPWTDRNHADEMEAKIRATGAWPAYIKALAFLVAPDAEHAARDVWYLSLNDLAAIATATPAQRVQAALSIVEAARGGEGER